MTRAWLWLGLGLAGMGCSLISLDDLTDGGPPGDASPSDGPAADVGPDVVADVAGDVASDVPAVTGWCATEAGPHTFCDDFDEGPLLSLLPTLNVHLGTFGIDSNASVSPPSSLYATVYSSDAGPIAVGSSTLDVAVTKYLWQYDVRADVGATGQEAIICPLSVVSATNTSYTIELAMAGLGDWLIYETSSDATYPGYSHDIGATIPMGEWTHISIQVDLQAATLVLQLNGNVQLAGGVSPNVTSGQSVIVGAGIVYTSSPSAWAMRLDNVTFDAL